MCVRLSSLHPNDTVEPESQRQHSDYDEAREQRLHCRRQRERDRRALEMAEQNEAQLAKRDRARRAAQSANQALSVAIEFIVLHSLLLQSSYFYY